MSLLQYREKVVTKGLLISYYLLFFFLCSFLSLNSKPLVKNTRTYTHFVYRQCAPSIHTHTFLTLVAIRKRKEKFGHSQVRMNFGNYIVRVVI